GQAAQALIEPPRRLVRQCRAGAGSLWKAARADGDVIHLTGVFDHLARAFRTQESDDSGDGRRVAELLQVEAHARERDAWEEVLQVEIDDDRLAAVRLGIANNRAPRQKAVRRRLDRQLAQDVRQHPLLRRRESAVWRAERARAAA